MHEEKKKLTTLQKEVLVGILLGDAHLETQNNGRTYRLKIEQSVEHKDYVFHLYGLFKEFCSKDEEKGPRFYKNGPKHNVSFATLADPVFNFYGKLFYKDKKKVIPKILKKLLTSKGFAYLYMDDGSMKSKDSKGVNLNLYNFSNSELDFLCIILKEKFSIDCWRTKDRSSSRIYVSGKSYEKLREVIYSDLLPCFHYKFPLERNR